MTQFPYDDNPDPDVSWTLSGQTTLLVTFWIRLMSHNNIKGQK